MSCYNFSKVSGVHGNFCLSCLQHRRTLKLDLHMFETANNFTYIYTFIWLVHEMHKFSCGKTLRPLICNFNISINELLKIRPTTDDFFVSASLFA